MLFEVYWWNISLIIAHQVGDAQISPHEVNEMTLYPFSTSIFDEKRKAAQKNRFLASPGCKTLVEPAKISDVGRAIEVRRNSRTSALRNAVQKRTYTKSYLQQTRDGDIAYGPPAMEFLTDFSVTELTTFMNKHHDGGRFACPLGCGIDCGRAAELARHVLEHCRRNSKRQKSKMCCPLCFKLQSRKDAIVRHVCRSHEMNIKDANHLVTEYIVGLGSPA